MNFIAHFTKLIQYTDWADTLCVNSLASIPSPPEKALLQLTHSVVARVLWYDRILSRLTPYSLWEQLPLEAIKRLSDVNTNDWLEFLSQKKDAELHNTYTYTNSSGARFTTSLHDILTHVINHSTHHRGQIVTILRQNDIAPPATDYIFYIRELEKKK